MDVSSVLQYLIQTYVPRPVSYFDSNFGEAENMIPLDPAYPRALRGDLLAGACRKAQEQGLSVERIYHCLDGSLQGIYVPQLSRGIFAFAVSGEEDPSVSALLEEAGQWYLQARRVHDLQERIYIEATDFPGVDQVTRETIEKLLGGISPGEKGRQVHRFFGAAAVNQRICYIPQLTEDLPRRYLIKGRPGTGKSTLLKKVAAAAEEKGCAVEVYHCSLDPESLDMVILRELGLCLFDSTAPHEFFPSRPGDEILDLYALCVAPGTDEAHHKELTLLEQEYGKLAEKGHSFLQQAHKVLEQREASLPSYTHQQVLQEGEKLLGQLF